MSLFNRNGKLGFNRLLRCSWRTLTGLGLLLGKYWRPKTRAESRCSNPTLTSSPVRWPKLVYLWSTLGFKRKYNKIGLRSPWRMGGRTILSIPRKSLRVLETWDLRLPRQRKLYLSSSRPLSLETIKSTKRCLKRFKLGQSISQSKSSLERVWS